MYLSRQRESWKSGELLCINTVWSASSLWCVPVRASPFPALLPGSGDLVDLQSSQFLGHAVLPRVECLLGRCDHMSLGHGDVERI